MPQQCTDGIDAITRRLGFTCRDAPAWIHLSNPFALSNWTLPVLELTVVAGAVGALWWAIRRLRRDGDPVNLVLWFASVIYLLIVEPPLYFPAVFGIDHSIGAVFAHNVFTVQFMYDRLPLYIVALYPAMATLAYEIVRGLGVFRDRGIVVGSVCVGFVHHCFYEVFDQLGPQWRWWGWNAGNSINRPSLAAVPMSSVLLFATIGPILLTVLTLALTTRPIGRGRRIGAPGFIVRTVIVALLVPVGLGIVNIPLALAGSGRPDSPARWAVYIAYLVAVAAIAVPALAGQWRTRSNAEEFAPNPYVRAFGTVYLLVLGALWLSALPDYLSASHGITRLGTPTGDIGYAAACYLIAAALTVSVSVGIHRTAPGTAPAQAVP